MRRLTIALIAAATLIAVAAIGGFAKTNTLAKAKATIKQTLLSADQQQLWSAWLSGREKALGVVYAAEYDPAQLTASPSASASSSGG